MSIGKRLRFRVFARDDFTCQYCGRHAPFVKLHVDHFIPRVRGGTDDYDNLRTACESCNLGKGTSLVAGVLDDIDTFDDCLQVAMCDPAFWPEPVV